jgi:hypothetical protein
MDRDWLEDIPISFHDFTRGWVSINYTPYTGTAGSFCIASGVWFAMRSGMKLSCGFNMMREGSYQVRGIR